MNSINNIKELSQTLNISFPSSFNNALITSVNLDEESNKIYIDIALNQLTNYEEIQSLKQQIIKKYENNVFLNFSFSDEQYQKEYIYNFLQSTIKKSKYAMFTNINDFIHFNNDNLYLITIKTNNIDNENQKNKIKELFNKLIRWGYDKLTYEFKYINLDNSYKETTNFLYSEKEILKYKEAKNIKKNENDFSFFTNNKVKIDTLQYKNNTRYKNMKLSEIKQLDNNDHFIESEALIFQQDYKFLPNSENNKHLYIFWVTDFNDGLQLQLFTKEPLSQEEKNILKDNNWINFKGKLISKFQNDKYSQILYLSDFKIAENAKLNNIDDYAGKKRIELHVSSKMNTMDGLLNPEEILEIAKNNNMVAVGLMDANGCQAYPKFFEQAKKIGIKPIYGTALSFLTNDFNIVNGDKNDNRNLRDLNYVSFDIETTSLMPRYGNIIEFGSMDIENLRLKNSQQFFIKTNKLLSDFTTKLTGITNEDLLNGLPVIQALEKIYDILNNKIVVAHNAKFDFNFLKQKFLEYNKPFPKFTIIDTLKVSRILFEDTRKHSLKALANHVGIDYNDEEAHRGDYDAKVLAEVWTNLITLLEKKNIITLQDLANYKNDSLIQREFTYEISTIAKNNFGLKEQFELLSKTLTNEYSSSPRIFLEEIKKTKNLLLGSSTLKSRLIEDYFFSSDEVFEQTLDIYDYIEIPAPQVFDHWIAYDYLTKEELYKGLKDIIFKAKKRNKIVIATADVKYYTLHDKQAYEIIVYSKGINNVRHYLYDYAKAKENKLIIPTQNFLTTKEMLDQFSFLDDKNLINEIVIENTHLISEMCEDIEVIKKDLFKPNFDNSELKLQELVYKNAYEKYGNPLPKHILERIQAELTPITTHGFSVIYWISHVLIKNSLDRGYIVGSRGSVGSSLTAYLANVSEVNPLPPHYLCKKCKYFELNSNIEITSGFDLDTKNCPNCNVLLDTDGQNIPFETFLGFDADKVPDIDLNFSGEIQPLIHNEIRKLFGESNTFKAGTVQTVADKTAYGYVKNYLEETKQEFSEVLINYLANKIKDLKRNTSQHPGGIIIVPKEYSVYDFTPINYPANDVGAEWKTTHFDYKAIHDNLLKLDILGHDNPTMIKFLEKTTNIKTSQIPKKDSKIISLFSSPEAMGIKSENINGEKTGALGIPEFGTSFVRRMLASSKPKTFADLISLSGLSHGESVWTNNAEDLVVKNGFKLSEVISCRDDILVNLMKIGVDRTNAFKIMEKVRKGKGLSLEEEEFLKKHNVPTWQIDSMKKIKYMFPKAHAAAYVLMAWWIAFYKLNYPLEFYASYLSIRPDNYELESMIDDKYGNKVLLKLKDLKKQESQKIISSTQKQLIPVFEIIQEMYARGFNIVNISLEKSLANDWIIDNKNKCLIPPFIAVTQLGQAAAESIVQARRESNFISIEDFKKRTKINSTLLKRLKDLGVFKNLDETNQMKLF
ncbi:PolC-type DNA polymerase III [Mycoplasma sp. 744]|uniref:PolC-type DNA polymerase III n=1 Tax=Mycoplasma sp. 744 TaxID=3108531 RepID=UPI002B1CEEA9|nr:PolC-type DNA polymerase III [Mycoplasma sp. 744]MEA4115215.1 PolC-type DNA polymerase III [Mycoplasma sp. 744]